MKDLLVIAMNVTVPIFAVSSMLSIGFQYSTGEILRPLRRVSGVVWSLVANFVLVPLLTYLILRMIPLELSLKIALFLVSCAAGAPFLVKLVQLARGDLALGATLLVLLLLVTMVYMPIIVPRVLPGTNIRWTAIALPLVTTMLLPLAAGHYVQAHCRDWAMRLLPVTSKISSVTLVLLIAGTVLANIGSIAGVIGTGAIPVSILVIAGAFAIGFLFGGSRLEARCVVGLGTAQRNIAAAMVVAIDGFDSPDVLVMVVVFSVVSFAILFPLAWALRWRERLGGASANEESV